MICQFASPVEIVDIHKQPEVHRINNSVALFPVKIFLLVLFSGCCFGRKILEKKI